jgi:hypothetical protein
MLYNVGWYNGEMEIETREEFNEWRWYLMVKKLYVEEDIEDIVWDMWYSGLLDGSIAFKDWMRIVDVMLNGRWF